MASIAFVNGAFQIAWAFDMAQSKKMVPVARQYLTLPLLYNTTRSTCLSSDMDVRSRQTGDYDVE